MSAEAVEKRSFGIAAAEEESAALIEQDVARGLENFPVRVWPLGAGPRPKPFQNAEGNKPVCLHRGLCGAKDGTQGLLHAELYTPDHVAGPGADIDPTQITFPGCACIKTPCHPGTCSCLRHENNYDDNLCLRDIGLEAKYAKPVFECNVLCHCGEHCRNRVVQNGLQFCLQVFQTDKKGWGLQTLEPIPKGRFVCEYAGEILGFSEVQRRIHLQTTHDPNYIIAIREHIYNGQVMETFVDPTYIGNIGRFLNHSCEPNLLMIPVRIDSMVPKLALFAARDILPGEELSYDYSGRFLNQISSKDKERIDHEQLRKPQLRKPCYCGAPSCATFLPYDSSLYCPLGKPDTS
nr:histone-lysine N-methyltransferase SETMAR isoform X2 [Peromyscus maniculatus bairdii]